MPPTPDSQRLDYVVGQLLAIQAVVVAIVETHLDPAALATKMEWATQTQLAKLETDRRTSAKMIKGYQHARALLLRETKRRRRKTA